MSFAFKPIYWSADKSSEVVFEPINELPAVEMVSACFVFALHKKGVVLVKPGRGWGLPGGHREDNESPEECVRRESLEEASIELESLKLIGRWKIEKKFESPFNEKYPGLAYQLLYVARASKLLPFSGEHETSERAVVSIENIRSVFEDFDDFEDILRYIIHENQAE